MFFDINNINYAYLVVSKNTEYAYNQVKEFVEMILNSTDLQNNADYKLIESEDGKSIKINQIRDMQSDVAIKPLKSDRKIYVIMDADKMNEQAQNCIP
jgi:DNA polymerase III gamma/tau subunit